MYQKFTKEEMIMILTHLGNLDSVAEPVLCCAGPCLKSTIGNIRKKIRIYLLAVAISSSEIHQR